MNGLCQCGCGRLTTISKINRYSRGVVKGAPVNFLKGHQFRKPLETRFWEKVQKSEESNSCWMWMGAKNGGGYGITWDGKRTIRATHVAFFLETGEWPTQDMCHKCDNPACVRFSHLFQGTARDNALDALKKGRLKQWNRGKCKLNSRQQEKIKEKHQNGMSYRALGRQYKVTHRFISKIVRRSL